MSPLLITFVSNFWLEILRVIYGSILNMLASWIIWAVVIVILRTPVTVEILIIVVVFVCFPPHAPIIPFKTINIILFQRSPPFKKLALYVYDFIVPISILTNLKFVLTCLLSYHFFYLWVLQLCNHFISCPNSWLYCSVHISLRNQSHFCSCPVNSSFWFANLWYLSEYSWRQACNWSSTNILIITPSFHFDSNWIKQFFLMIVRSKLFRYCFFAGLFILWPFPINTTWNKNNNAWLNLSIFLYPCIIIWHKYWRIKAIRKSLTTHIIFPPIWLVVEKNRFGIISHEEPACE